MNSGKRRWRAVPLLLVGVALLTWWLLSVKSSGGVQVRFLGYAFETPNLSLDFFSYGGRANPAKRGARVARFFITNACDFPVSCSLVVRYTNGFGSFFPRDLSLEPHTATNFTGLASPPKTSSLASARAPSWTEWTNAWWLTVAYRKTPPLEGIEEWRYRAALWLYRGKHVRLGQFLNPVKIEAIETDLIPPDSP